MVNRNLLRSLDSDADGWESELAVAMEGIDRPEDAYTETATIGANEIVEGKVLRVEGDYVLVDVGYKSEGAISLREWDEEEEPPEKGQILKVLVEELEDAQGGTESSTIVLSKRKAEAIAAWNEVMDKVKVGDVVTGTATKKIRGGLLVDIGVHVFLPASQVDIRRPSDIGDYIGRTLQCSVLSIDESRHNIVVSRRSLIEDQRQKDREELFKTLTIGESRMGVVKNIADFGAFVDLGGCDGLLHITDMSWSRISHPSEMVAIDQELEVVILGIDHEKERIALGLKQMEASPWENIEEKYPVGAKVTGSVVNVMAYGAFVKLEEGIEGLVHISEMSWTKRINHPSEMVDIGDEVEVVVLGINKEKQNISLGMKQTQDNPWDAVADRYPEDKVVKGTVRNLTNYGAFVELEEGVDGLLHVSDMSWTRKITHPSEMVSKGLELECKVLSVDQDRKRIALGLKQMTADPWETDIPGKYQPGQLVTGKVTKLSNFGVFIELEPELEGLLHISELADHKVENPEEIVKVGEDIEVKIMRVDQDERKIALSRKRVEWAEEAEDEMSEGGSPKSGKSEAELKGGLGGDNSGQLIATPAAEQKPESVAVAEASSEEAEGQAEPEEKSAEE